jgi:AraC-like DNA-binding protein
MAHPRPLARHRLFRSGDLDETREAVARIFCPHRLDSMDGGPFDACHHHVRGENLSLNYIEYGAKVRIEPGRLDRFYLLQIPLCGGAEIRNGVFQFLSDANHAVVLNPHLPTTMLWTPQTRQVLVQVDRKALQDHATTLLGAKAPAPLTFENTMHLNAPKAIALRQMIQFLLSEIDAERLILGDAGLMSRQVENTLMTGLIEAVPNNYAPLIGKQASDISPRKLRLAEEYITANLHQQICLDDIARAANATPRNLQDIFRQFRNCSPLQFWRDQRLGAARNDLLCADDNDSVTQIAMRWGFTHLGRFSDVYRKAFGETPSTTLDQGLKLRRAFSDDGSPRCGSPLRKGPTRH